MEGKDQSTVRPVRGKGLVLNGSFPMARAVVLSMRPIQWTKSLLVFLPLAFSLGEKWELDDTGLFGELFLRALIGSLIFCALSGAVYLINDIFDRERDRVHPRKRKRPIASGELPLAVARTSAVLLLAGSISSSFIMGTGFGIVSVAFVAMNLGYSSFLKRLIILDVMMVSAGYLIRVVAGALVIDVTVSPWLYTTISLGALFIALGKRYSELKSAKERAAEQRSVLEEYSEPYLSQLITITSTATLVAYALYTFTASNVPDDHSMMLTGPFVVFGLFRYLYLVNHTNDAESPELVILKDKPLLIDVLLWAATAILVLALHTSDPTIAALSP